MLNNIFKLSLLAMSIVSANACVVSNKMPGTPDAVDGEYGWRHSAMYPQGRHIAADQTLNRMAAFDRNENNLIDADEAAAEAERVFLFMDMDADGEVTETEYMAMHMGPQATPVKTGPRYDQQQARKLARYKPMDTDGDGSVSQAEFLAAARIRHEEADSDDDGQVSVWEFRSVRR